MCVSGEYPVPASSWRYMGHSVPGFAVAAEPERPACWLFRDWEKSSSSAAMPGAPIDRMERMTVALRLRWPTVYGDWIQATKSRRREEKSGEILYSRPDNPMTRPATA